MIVKVKGNMKSSFINQEYNLKCINRKVEAIENIIVKAGKFSCYKVACEINLKNTSKISTIKSPKEIVIYKTYWYAKGIGIVKIEESNPDGKLLSYTELTEIKEQK